MIELKAFDVGLGQYCEDGSPCVVAFDAERNPRLLNEKVYLKSEADKEFCKQKRKRCLAMAERCKYRMYHISGILEHEIAKIYPNVTEVKRYTWKKSRMYYWRNLLLVLAEKFKEG